MTLTPSQPISISITSSRLADAWNSCARNWTTTQRRSYANDLGGGRPLVAVADNVNQAKGDQDPATWMPPAQLRSLPIHHRVGGGEAALAAHCRQFGEVGADLLGEQLSERHDHCDARHLTLNRSSPRQHIDWAVWRNEPSSI